MPDEKVMPDRDFINLKSRRAGQAAIFLIVLLAVLLAFVLTLRMKTNLLPLEPMGLGLSESFDNALRRS